MHRHLAAERVNSSALPVDSSATITPILPRPSMTELCTYLPIAPLPTDSDAARRSVMFSPILAIVSAIDSATVMLPALAALIFSTSVPTTSATSAIIFTRPWNRSLRATKSVSEFTSTTTPLVPCTCDADQPFGGDAAGFLRGLGQTLLAQPILRRRHVAVGLGERGLAIHHAGAGRLAQFLDHLCADICHRTLSLIRSGRSARPARTCNGETPADYSAVSSLALAIQPATRPGRPTSSPTLCAAFSLSSAICE